MKKKQYLLLQGWLSALSVIVILTFFAFQKSSEIDEFGMIFGILMLLFLSYKSYACFKKIRHTREEDMVYQPSTDASKTEITSYYKRIFYISIPVFIILSIEIYFDLKDLEQGNAESVRIWAPIAFLYEHGGFWLGVLSTPILGILCLFVLWKKIKRTKASD